VRYLNGRQIDGNGQLRMHLRFLAETAERRGETDNVTAAAVVPVG